MYKMHQFGGAQTFRPENAVRRAKELLAQDQPGMALKVCQDVIRNRRNRIWTPTHEEIMLMIVNLSVELKRSVKEDLIHYRGLAAVPNVNSLEKVIETLVEKGEERALAAKEASEDAASVLQAAAQADEEEGVAELDEKGLGDETPEAMILRTVSQEESKDRISREHLTPWLRYLNECYRTSLEVCNRQAKLETVFHKTAIRAFNFCLEYTQKQWFRNHGVRLLRDHLTQAMHTQNRQQQEHRSNMLLSNPEVFNVMVEARFKQLEVAVKFDSWQHAYQAIEDIHTLINYFKRVPKQSMMYDYFKQLANIFWESKNWLFHSYSLMKLFNLSKQKAKQDPEERRVLASKVILAVLCIPFWNHEPPTCLSPFLQNLEREKAAKMTELLGSNHPPNRMSLMHDMLKKDPKNLGVFNCADKEIIDLYNIVESNVQPLTMAEQLSPILKWMEEKELAEYVPYVREVAAVSVMVQSSKVYSTISLDSLRDMCPVDSFERLEALLVAVARSEANSVQMVIDHQARAVHFEDADISSAIISSALPNLRKEFANINRMLVERNEVERKQQEQEIEQYRRVLPKRVKEMQKDERQAVQRRKMIIEKRKEREEQRQLERIKARQLQEREEKEKTRVKEQEKVEKKRLEREELDKKEQQKKEQEEFASRLVDQFKNDMGGIKVKRLQETLSSSAAETAESADAQGAVDKVRAEMQRMMLEQKEKEESKRLEEWQKVHWYERAARDMEVPLIREAFKKRQAQLKADAEARVANQKAQARKDWEEAQEAKKRLSRMSDSMEAFKNKIFEEREKWATMFADKRMAQLKEEGELMARTGRTDIAATGVLSKGEEEKPAAAPAPAPAPAASTEAPAEDAPKKGAWKPRHQRTEADAAPAPAPAPAAEEPAAEAPAAEASGDGAPKKQAWQPKHKAGFKVQL
eukprot:Hpha_TRINITY_DN15275_c2_g6::TRINITY_DN15275_c2_g6_i1::g.64389::m.64389/K03254/EIF3A; translation initiation factor 3 subunit A